MGPLLVLIVIYLVVGFIGMALFLAWAILLGSLLTHLLPFSLLEASLLVSLATIVVGYLMSRFLSSVSPFDMESDDDPVTRLPVIAIPASRFYKTPSDKTWEAWLRYYLANAIVSTFEETPRLTRAIAMPQRQELAIRLAEIGVERLKTKSTRAKRLKLTLDDLKQQMAKMDLKPYDDDLLQIAVSAFNMALLQPEIERVARTKVWQTVTDRFDR